MLYNKLDTLQDVRKFNIKPYLDKPVLVFIYMKGCPYCDMMEPEWKKFCNKNTMINTLDINNSVVDEFKKHRPFFDVDDMYFPSLKLTKKYKTIKYDGDRTSKDIHAFVSNNIKSQIATKPKKHEIQQTMNIHDTEESEKEEEENKKSKKSNTKKNKESEKEEEENKKSKKRNTKKNKESEKEEEEENKKSKKRNTKKNKESEKEEVENKESKKRKPKKKDLKT